MTGFGHKSETKKNRRRQKTQIINQDFIQKAINYHVQGDLENAEKMYRIAIDRGFLDATIYSNLKPPSVVVIPGVAEKVRRQGEIQAEVPQRFVVKAISKN